MVLTTPIIIATLAIGLGIGYALQRGRGCTNSAFRNLLLFGNTELALMIVIIVTVELIGYYFLSMGHLGFVFQSSPLPFSYLLIPVGGFIFGLGTVFAGGCAGGTCYRVGEGSMSSLLALLGFTTGIGVLAVGPLASPIINLRQQSLIIHEGQSPSLDQFLPRWFWTVLATVVLLLTIIYYQQRQRQEKNILTHLSPNWTPINTGIVIGILAVIARYVSTLSGRPFGLSTTDGIAQLVLLVTKFQSLQWAGIFIITLIAGSTFASLINNEFQISVPARDEVSRFFGGGVLLGIGAILGLGCNFGHIFGGLPELGISSIVSLLFMMLGNYVGSNLFYLQLDNELPTSTPISKMDTL